MDSMMEHSKLPLALPGTKANSDISQIYLRLLRGDIITSMDAVFADHTICLTQYISIMRRKFNIPVQDEWMKVCKRKKVKKYWIAR